MKNIAVLAGGYTSERQISLNSGNQILENIDRNLYNAYLVDVRKDGFFCIFNGKEYSVDLNKFAVEIEGEPTKFDYAYLALHGSPGEDGKVQALLDILGIPYSACDVFSSMITFNKIAAKKMLADEGIAMAKMAIIRGENPFDVDEIIEKVGLPCFVKPEDCRLRAGFPSNGNLDQERLFRYRSKIYSRSHQRNNPCPH